MPAKAPPIPTPRPTDPASRPRATQLPEPRWLLGWVYVGRLALVSAFLLRATWIVEAPSQRVLVPGLLTLLTVAYTALAFVLTHRQRRPPSRSFIYSQVVYDAATQTYYIVSSTRTSEGPAVRAYTSRDLLTWEGPHIIFQTLFWKSVPRAARGKSKALSLRAK